MSIEVQIHAIDNATEELHIIMIGWELMVAGPRLQEEIDLGLHPDLFDGAPTA